MATRAFLLCGDEKAVQAVTQILDELEVSFEHSSEPAFSLKRLATQRFDLLVVDCDNAQNATQVFNSARASSQNKTSIAIAIVEGKAGVPNAFRLGASLVLTKPVSLEQARNTLRTGIGMTRKEGQDIKPTAPVTAPVASATASAPVISAPNAAPVVPAPVAPLRPPAVVTPVSVAPPAPPAPSVLTRAPEPPKVSAPPAPVVEKPVLPRPVVPVAPTQEYKPALTNFTEPKAQPAPVPAISLTKAATATAGPAASKDFDSVFASSPADKGTAVKATNVKEIKTVPEDLKDVKSPTLSIVDPLAEEDALDPVKDHGVPSFGAMGKQPFAGMEKLEPSGGGGKGWLIAALVVLVLAGAGCGAWLTQPSFRKFVAWEYLNTMSKIGALRGQPQTSAATPLMPAPAPAPAAAQPVAISPSPAADAAGMGNATENANNAAASGTAAATSDASATNQPTSQSPADSNAQKTPSVQPAKQDTSSNHSAASPSLVKASASLPAPATAKAPSSDLLEVPEDFADDQIVRRVHPTYPKQAVARKLHGTVVLQAIVNKQGKVDSLQLVSGDPLLAQAAASAVKQWRYKPYSHNGEPTDFQTRVTVDFKAP
jgi:TonB family protein